MPHSDGAGVRMNRVIASRELDMVDPFLLLDEFRSDDPRDYLAGFPDHPHRGFDTVTYMLAGRMRHKDNHGHDGVIESGGVQWMRAGRGIVHSEMPEQESGLMWGFQLWVNLPKEQKMAPPAYQEFDRSGIPEETHEDGVSIRVIAGTTARGTTGPVQEIPTAPVYFDISLPGGTEIREPVSIDASVFVYVYEGEAAIISAGESTAPLRRGTIAILAPGDGVHIQAMAADTKVLLLAAQPLYEPVARGGPFVMNTRAEVMQAFDDFNNGLF